MFVMAQDLTNGESKPEGGGYPYTSLAPSLKISDAVKELGGANHPVPKSSLADFLKESEKSASFLQRIMAAKIFGLIEGRNEYSLTEVGKHYYFPTDRTKEEALLDIFCEPAPFRELIKRFDGDKLPSRVVLGNILQLQLKVPESWKDRVAAFFVNSAEFAGALDSTGFLRVKANKQAKSMPTVVSTHGKAPPPPPSGTPEIFSEVEDHTLHLDKERRFRISSPLFITQSEYDRICKWLAVTLIVEVETKE